MHAQRPVEQSASLISECIFVALLNPSLTLHRQPCLALSKGLKRRGSLGKCVRESQSPIGKRIGRPRQNGERGNGTFELVVEFGQWHNDSFDELAIVKMLLRRLVRLRELYIDGDHLPRIRSALLSLLARQLSDMASKPGKEIPACWRSSTQGPRQSSG